MNKPAQSIDVDIYQWGEMINSRFGPSSEALRCVLNVLLRHMGRRNGAWPSQITIADRSQKSRRQTQRLLDEAQLTGWLKVQLMRRTDNGSNWKVSVYRATVPAGLADYVPPRPGEDDPTYRNDENAVPELTPEREDTALSAPRTNGGDTQMTPRQQNDRENKDNAAPHRGVTQMTPPSDGSVK
jgi:hypothetical protein